MMNKQVKFLFQKIKLIKSQILFLFTLLMATTQLQCMPMQDDEWAGKHGRRERQCNTKGGRKCINDMLAPVNDLTSIKDLNNPADLSTNIDLTTNPDLATNDLYTQQPNDLSIINVPDLKQPQSVPGDYSMGVKIRLTPIATNSQKVSFGLPLPLGAVNSPLTMSVRINGNYISAQISELLPELNSTGTRVGARSVLIQLDPALIANTGTDVEVYWTGSTVSTNITPITFNDEAVSFSSPSIVPTATRTIQQTGSTYTLVETNHIDKTVFTGREPRILATFPEGYLGYTGILGHILSKTEVASRPDLTGLQFLSAAIENVLRSAMYDEPYNINPDPNSLPDFAATYEAWLYDRCATFLIGYTHVGDTKMLRHGLRSCSYYSSQIGLTATSRGIFLGKPDADIKYSHTRGLYAYYALTGDERALQSLQAMAEMWLAEPLFVAPYRQGHLRGIDKLWTERLLGTSMEALLYGYKLSGETKYLTAFNEMLNTAYKHISGDQAMLNEINPGANFPPQNCFIHNATQAAEGNLDKPWCSSWMSELTIDVLLQWHELSGDVRVPEIITRLGRFLRDTGANYFRGNPLNDSFLAPAICYNAADEENPRVLVPLYGAGINAFGVRNTSGEYEDYEHCTDAAALLAASRWSLENGAISLAPPSPFIDEKQSFEALHNEFLYCSSWTFSNEHRPHRNPATWTSNQLAAGASDPATFIQAQKIGYPQYQLAPLRKIGWWFNMAALQFGLLNDASIQIPTISAGWIQASPPAQFCQ